VHLFPDTYGVSTGLASHVDYDVDPRGARFVMLGAQAGRVAAELGVILNWFEELRRLAPPAP